MRLPQTLFGRLLLVFMLFGAVMTGALLVVMQVSHRLYHLEFDQTVNRELARNYVHSNFLLTDVPLTVSTLHQGIGKLAAANPGVDIYLLDDDGSIVASSVPGRNWRRTRVDMDPIHEFLAGHGAPILADDPRDATRGVLGSTLSSPTALRTSCTSYCAAASTGAARLRTVLRGRRRGGDPDCGPAGGRSQPVLPASADAPPRRAGGAIAAPRRARHSGASANGHRRLGGDRSIAQAINDAARIERAMETLKATDVMRRDTLASICDLRTPLTTLLTHPRRCK